MQIILNWENNRFFQAINCFHDFTQQYIFLQFYCLFYFIACGLYAEMKLKLGAAGIFPGKPLSCYCHIKENEVALKLLS